MKREQDSLIERCIARDTTLGSIHVKAELDRLARHVRKLKRFAPAPVIGCHCQICRLREQSTGAYLNRQDVLALLKEARR